MEFRWIALITLWTLIAGPMFDAPVGSPPEHGSQSIAADAPRNSAPRNADAHRNPPDVNFYSARD